MDNITMKTANYPATFRSYISRRAEQILAQVQATPHLLPDELRKQALHTLSYALGLAEAWPVTRELLLAMAPKMEQAGHRADWMAYLEQGMRSGESQGDLGAVAKCQLQLGLLYRLISDFEQAKAWLTRSQDNFAQVTDAVGQARALNERAWVGYLQHHYVEATAALHQALALLPATHPERGMSYRVFGMIAIDQGQWQEAEDYHRQALAVFEQEDDPRRIAWSHQNLAVAMMGQSKFTEALSYYQKAANTLHATKDVHNWAIIQMNLGLIHLYLGKPNLSLPYLFEAEKVINKLNDRVQKARVHTNRGLVYLALHEFLEAEINFLFACKLFTKLGDISWRLNALDGLAMTYIAQQQFIPAIEILEAALLELPSIANAPNYAYLLNSLNQHLQQARDGKANLA